MCPELAVTANTFMGDKYEASSASVPSTNEQHVVKCSHTSSGVL